MLTKVDEVRFLDKRKRWYEKKGTRTASVFGRGSRQSRILAFTGSSIPANKISLRRKLNGDLEWTVGNLEAKLYLSQRPSDSAVFLDALYKGVYEAVFLYRWSVPMYPDTRYMVALVIQQGNIAEKVGLILVTCDDNDSTFREVLSILSKPVQYQLK
jgi:hypothetical protein